jgi:enoyl-CoA hydratase/carnithine racemase
MSAIRYEVRDRTAYITLDRPERLNAITAEMSRAPTTTRRCAC